MVGIIRALVHSPEYLQFLESAYDRWQLTEGASEEMVPSVHPNGRASSYPISVDVQAGYHFFDSTCPIGAGTWEAACASANCAVRAADELLAGTDAIYALSRPPGHHAQADMGGGAPFVGNWARSIKTPKCPERGLIGSEEEI